MNRPSGLLNSDGAPIPAAEVAKVRTQAAAYNAASTSHPDMATWRPGLYSGQAALSVERDGIAARIQDLARNDGWASAALARQVDNVVGAGWRLSSKPNYRSLGISAEDAAELATAIEAAWADYVNDPGFWCDAERVGTMGDVLGLAYRHRCADGEALAVIPWLERGGPYATAVQVIDPDRLSNPRNTLDSEFLRGGVEFDSNGAAVAYHIRDAHPGDRFVAGISHATWTRQPRETSFGRPYTVHAYDRDRAGMKRPQPPLAPILKKLKQLTRFDEAELQAAIINAILAAFITSPTDPEILAESLSGDLDNSPLAKLSDMRGAYYGQKPVRLEGASVTYLSPGDEVMMPNATHPGSQFEPFMRAGLRNVAAAAGLTYEQLTMDWSQVNYSSARGALLEVWRGLTARKDAFAAKFMTPIYCAWLEEAIDRGRVRLPEGAPSFEASRAAWCRAEWIGPGRGWIDPQKEAQAAGIRMANDLSTLERECAEQGLDWQEVMHQRARERALASELGLPMDPEAAMNAPQAVPDPENRESRSA